MRGFKQWLKYAVVWLAICFSVGAAMNYFFDLNFWFSSAGFGAALVINGLIADWEDRQPGGWDDW